LIAVETEGAYCRTVPSDEEFEDGPETTEPLFCRRSTVACRCNCSATYAPWEPDLVVGGDVCDIAGPGGSVRQSEGAGVLSYETLETPDSELESIEDSVFVVSCATWSCRTWVFRYAPGVGSPEEDLALGRDIRDGGQR
jgi:hypothetical protein